MPKRNQMRRSQLKPGHIAEGLGWFSIALGVAQLIAPRAMCRITGLPDAPGFMRVCGLREIVCGLGLLTHEDTVAWLHARMAGDAMDLAALAGITVASRSSLPRVATTTAVAAGIAALDTYVSRAVARAESKVPRHVRASIVVNRPADELYRYWRDFENFPRILPHVEAVQPLGSDCLHWVAIAPGGKRVEWDAEIIDDRPNERLAWRSLEGSEIYNAGSVRFDPAPGGAGTYVTVELLYQPPAGTIGTTVAKVFGREPSPEVRADLLALKALMENGAAEAATSAMNGGR